MASDYIIEVTEADFEFEVLAYSQQAPVVVDFWAEWCVPCKSLDPILRRLTEEAGGTFRLARVNVDQNPSLTRRYTITSIPVVKVFREGKVISEFMGAQPEPRVREFIQAIAPSPADLLVEKGQSMLELGEWHAAELAFREVLQENESSTPALLGLIKCLLAQAKVSEAKSLLKTFPPSREYAGAEALRPLVEVLIRQQNGDAFSENPLEAAYTRALKLFLRGNVEASLDGLLDILREDKRYHGGEVRQVILGIFELIGENNETTRQYRTELASVLF